MQVAGVARDWPAPSLMHRRRVVRDRIRYVGLDVHKEGIVVAIADDGIRVAVREYSRVAKTAMALDRLMGKIADETARRGRAGHWPYQGRGPHGSQLSERPRGATASMPCCSPLPVRLRSSPALALRALFQALAAVFLCPRSA